MPSQPKSETPPWVALIVTLAMLLLAPQCGSPLQAQESGAETTVSFQPDSTSVGKLLQQLDSRLYRDREMATDELIQMGPEIFEPLTSHFFDASSEAGWRIHRILEGIGKNAQEKDFLKSIAIIQVLYGAQDDRNQQRLAELQYQWKATRRADAAKRLKALGFKFEAPQTLPFNNFAGVHLRVLPPNQGRGIEIPRFGGGMKIEVNEPDPTVEAVRPVKWEDPRLDRDKSEQKLESIIAGNTEENLAIKGLLPSAQSVPLPPGTLEAPEGWKSDDESLELINNLSTLSSLTLRRQEIDTNLQKFIAGQTKLKNLILVDCSFSKTSDQFSLPKSIYRYEFDGSLPPAESLVAIGTISSLKLRRLTLSNEIATVLSKGQIKLIELEEVKFDRESIRKLVSIQGLLQVTISLCPLELSWLEDVRRNNDRLIQAAPKAFLGVQGAEAFIGREFTGCQISQVVPGTAAADAGMESLDIVTEVEGETIRRFEDLRLLISQKKPGETMNLEVLRDNKKVKLEVKLGSLAGVIP